MLDVRMFDAVYQSVRGVAKKARYGRDDDDMEVSVTVDWLNRDLKGTAVGMTEPQRTQAVSFQQEI